MRRDLPNGINPLDLDAELIANQILLSGGLATVEECGMFDITAQRKSDEVECEPPLTVARVSRWHTFATEGACLRSIYE